MARRPHQSVVAKDAAQRSIDNKISVLKAWAESGIPTLRDSQGRELVDGNDSKLLEFFPTSLRQFKLWNGSQNSDSIRASLPIFKATGNDTLSRRPHCAELARKAMSAAVERAHLQTASGRLARVRKLEMEVRALESALKTRVTEVREQQREIRRLLLENDAIQARLDRERAEFKRVFESISGELEDEKRRAAGLAASLSKVSPMVTARTIR